MKGRARVIFTVIFMMVFFLPSGGYQSAAFAKPIRLKLFFFLPDTPPENVPIHMFMDKVNQKAHGKLVIRFGGGPDAIAPPNLASAVQRGVVQLASHILSLIDAVVPGARAIIHNELPLEDFGARAQDYIQRMFNDAGLYYLGLSHAVEPQTFNHLFTVRKRITRLQDFAGLRMASPSPLAFPFYRALKASPVLIPLHNYFVAAERGVIDGLVSTLSINVQMGLYRLNKYVVDHTFHSSPDVFMMNLEAWRKLPKDLQTIMKAAAIEVEQEYPAYRKQEEVEIRKKMKAAGVEFIKFSPAEAKRYLDLNKEASWAAEIKKNPAHVSKLKQLITR